MPDSLHLRARNGYATITIEEMRLADRTLLTITPDDTLGAGYYDASSQLDEVSLGRLLYWLQTGVALPDGDERIPKPFTAGPESRGD